MPTVLVVDDSSSDRTLTGGLLRRDAADLIVEFAEDGSSALDKIRVIDPDVVLTDLLMPNMDGMELVARVKMSHPDLPVILMTGQGSEQLAIEALDQGAISYVAKTELNTTLVETVRQVLDLTRTQRSYKKLTRCLADAQFRFNLDNDPTLISPLVDMLQQMLFDMGVCDWSEQGRFGVAMDEALVNAIYHGNLQLPVQQLKMTRSQIRAGNVADFLEERASGPPYCDRKVFVEATISRDQARLIVRDEGEGFDTNIIPQARDPATMEGNAGRGLILMQNFMDEVSFNPAGNEVTMIKRKDSAES